MPYRVDKDHIKLSDTQDRRRKISDAQREEIRTLYDAGHSIRSIARQYCVSPRTVSTICKPETLATLRAYTKEHWREFRHDREYCTAKARETRRYRQRVLGGTDIPNTIPTKVNK